MRPIRIDLWSRRATPDPCIAQAVREALPELCFRFGFANLQKNELCRRAGISEAEYHRSYRDLDDCFARVYQDFAGEFMMRMFAAFESDLTWRPQIRAVAYELLRYLEEDPARAHFTVVDALNAGEEAQLIRDMVFSGLFAFIDQGRQQMADPDALTPATAQSVGGGIFRQIRVTVEERRFGDLEGLVPSLMYAVVMPYLGPVAAAEELEIADLHSGR